MIVKIGNCKVCNKTILKSSKERLRYKNYCSQSCYYSLWRKSVVRKVTTWKKVEGTGCCICGFSPIDWAHIKARQSGGQNKKENLAPLCPNHHRLYDIGELSKKEISMIKSALELNIKSKCSLNKYTHNFNK